MQNQDLQDLRISRMNTKDILAKMQKAVCPPLAGAGGGIKSSNHPQPLLIQGGELKAVMSLY